MPSAPVVKRSRYSYAETIDRLTGAVNAAGNLFFPSIDQAEAARSVGLELRPTLLFSFGNPKAGTPLMDAYPLTALALPLKVLVWEENGSVRIAYARMSELLPAFGVAADDPRIAAMDHALESITDSLL